MGAGGWAPPPSPLTLTTAPLRPSPHPFGIFGARRPACPLYRCFRRHMNMAQFTLITGLLISLTLSGKVVTRFIFSITCQITFCYDYRYYIFGLSMPVWTGSKMKQFATKLPTSLYQLYRRAAATICPAPLLSLWASKRLYPPSQAHTAT